MANEAADVAALQAMAYTERKPYLAKLKKENPQEWKRITKILEDNLDEWKNVKDNKEIITQVRNYRTELESQVEEWGRGNLAVSDLSLTAVFTCKDPDVKRYSFYNPTGGKEKDGKWDTIREGLDEYLPWIVDLGANAEDWVYDHQTREYGSKVPANAKNFRGSTAGNRPKTLAEILKRKT